MGHGLTGDAQMRAVTLLAAAAIGLLASVLIVARSLLASQDSSPGRRALAHWLPIAITAVVATLLNHVEIAIGLVFGTSVAALSTVVGFVTMMGPAYDIPERARRIWLFLPVPAILAFVIGFRGKLDPFDVLLLAVQGVFMLMIWLAPPERELLDDDWLDLSQASRASRPRWVYFAMAGCGLALCGEAAWAATRGAVQWVDAGGLYPTGIIAATVLSIVLIMPMISTGAPVAAAGRAWVPITAQIGVVFLNLGALLPLVAALSIRAKWISHVATTAPAQVGWIPVLFPRIAWRIDAVVLMILSLLFVPASLGKIKFNRQLAGWLVVAYCAYLLAVLWWAVSN